MNELQAKDLSESPVITVCLAVYQAEPFIAATLVSIATQTFPHFRCVISDDGSSDRTLSICQQLTRDDPRFELMQNARRLGWIGNVNRVLELINEEFFVIAAHDDELEASYLENLLQALESCPGAVVAYSDMREVQNNLPDINLTYSRLEHCNTAFQRAAGVISQQGTWWIPYRGLVRRKLLSEPPQLYYNRAGEFSADLTWVLALAMAGSFVRVPGLLLTKYKKPGSVSSQWTFTPREHAAVLESCGQLVWNSGMPLIQRACLLLLLLFRFTRKLAWDVWQWASKTLMGSVTNSHDAN